MIDTLIIKLVDDGAISITIIQKYINDLHTYIYQF